MTRHIPHLTHLPCWRDRYCGVILVLIVSIQVCLSPSTFFISVATHSVAGHHAKPPRRGAGTRDALELPARQVLFLERYTAFELEERFESETQLEAPFVDALPRVGSQNHLVISRIGAVSAEARLSVLKSRGLPLIC